MKFLDLIALITEGGAIMFSERTRQAMPRMIHNLLCTVSRRYRVKHCRHVDELPPRMSRRLYRECTEMDPRSWDSVDDFMRDLIRECEEDDRAEAAAEAERKAHPGFFRRVAAIFA